MVPKKSKVGSRVRAPSSAPIKPPEINGFGGNNENHVQKPVQKFTAYMHYKPAKLYPVKQTKANLNTDWHVRYFIRGENGWEDFRTRLQINRIKDLKEKKEYGRELVRICNELLSEGISPVNFKGSVFSPIDPATEIRNMPVSKGWEWAKEKHEPNVSPAQRSRYKSDFNKFTPSLKKTGLDKVTVGDFRKSHLRILMDYIQKKYKLSNTNYNKHVETLQGIYRAFRKYDVFDISPLAGFERKEGEDVKKFLPLTPEEKKTVFEQFNGRDIMGVLLTNYHTALRPVEVRALQIYNLFETERAFKIKRNEKVIMRGEEKRKTKTKVDRYVPIPDELHEYLIRMNLHQYPKDWYIFSDNYLPGAKFIPPQPEEKAWRKEIIIGKGINKKLYGLKSTGMGDRVDSGVDFEAVSKGAGHTSKKTSEIYTDRNTVKMGKELREKAKRFVEKE